MRFLHIINRDFNQIYCFLLPAVFLCFPYILSVSQHSLVSSYIHYAMPPMPLRKKRKSQQKKHYYTSIPNSENIPPPIAIDVNKPIALGLQKS